MGRDEIKVGDFIRTEKGEITKIDENLKEFIEQHKSISEKYNVEFLGKIKHSKNIIDLIEVGDYVNDYKIEKIFFDFANECWHLVMADKKHIFNEDIKSIVTKEQFELVKYNF